MDNFDEFFDEDADYYTPTLNDNPSLPDYLSTIVVFDGGNMLMSRFAMRIYGVVGLFFTFLVLAMRIALMPHLFYNSVKLVSFSNLCMFVISIMQIIQTVIQLSHGYAFFTARLRVPEYTVYTCAINCAAWAVQSLHYLVLVPSTVIQSIFAEKQSKNNSSRGTHLFAYYLLFTLLIFFLFIILNLPSLHYSTLFLDVPMWMISGEKSLPYSHFFSTINHRIDAIVCFVILFSVLILFISYPCFGYNSSAPLREIMLSSLYFAFTTMVYILRTYVFNDLGFGKNKHLAALFYIFGVLWAAGKPAIYIYVNRRRSGWSVSIVPFS